MEKKILQLLLQGHEPTSFSSQVWEQFSEKYILLDQVKSSLQLKCEYYIIYLHMYKYKITWWPWTGLDITR